MQTKIASWGNSLAVRLPKHIVLRLKLHAGSNVLVRTQKRSVIIEPVTEDVNLSLSDLVAEITPENIHENLLEDKPQGQEIW